MIRFVALVVLSAVTARDVPRLPPAEEAHRDALTRYGLGLIRAHNDRPVEAIKHFEAAAKSDPCCSEPLKPLVKLYADLGRDAAAIRTAKKALELDPTDAETAHTLGKLYFDAKRFADAVAVLKQAAESPQLAKRAAKRYGVMRDLGRAAEAARDWPTAENALRESLKLTTDEREWAGIREKLGQVLTERKQYPEAVAAFAEARNLFEKLNDPNAAARIHWNLSGVLSAQGKVDDAMAQLSKFLALKPSGVAPYERLADLLRRLGLGSKVPATLTKLADENPKNEAIRWVLATEVARTNPDAAENLFRDLAERTTDPLFFQMLVRFHKTTNRMASLLDLSDQLFNTARGSKGGAKPDPSFIAKPADVDRARALANAVKAEPDLSARLLRQVAADARAGVTRAADTWELAAGLAERDGQVETAELVLRQLVRNGNGGEDAYYRLLELLAKQRKWIELRDETEPASRPSRSMSLSPVVFLAIAQAELGEAALALKTIETAVDKVKGEGRPWARTRKVYVLNVLGRHKEAVAECFDMLNEFSMAKNAIGVRQSRIALSNSYLSLKDYPKAEAELRKILDDDPDDMLILNNLGYNLADQGRKLDEAEQLIRRALELDAHERRMKGDPEGESGTYLDSLAWVLFRRGKVKEARELLEKVAKLPETASDAVVWDHLGDVRFREGATGSARDAWTKAAELYKNSHQGRQGGRRDEVLRKLKQTE